MNTTFISSRYHIPWANLGQEVNEASPIVLREGTKAAIEG